MSNVIDQARALADAGEVNAARSIYKQILQTESGNPDLLEEVGFFEAQAGCFPEAIGLMKLALKIRPNDPISHLNIAETYRLFGANDEAKHHYNKVIETSPGEPDAYFGLANLEISTENWSSASANLELALKHNPNDIEGLHLHASVLRNLAEWKKAEECYLTALRLSPNSFEITFDLAKFYFEANRLDQAIEYFYKAEELSPLPDEDMLNFAHALTVTGRAKEAVPIAHKLLLSSKLTATAITRRGTTFSTLGMFDEAESDFRKALKISPKAYSPYEQLGTVHRLTDKDLQHLEHLVTLPDLTEDAQIGFNFALYNGYKDRKEYAKSFEHLKRACDLHLAANPIEAADIVDTTTTVIQTFDKEFFKDRASFGHKKPGAVFVVGMPRSGTTLTERVLSSHPNAIGRGERFAVPNIIDDIEGYPETLAEISAAAASESGRRLLNDMLSTADQETFAVDKLPGNFRNLSVISLFLPNAKIIWCKRNPIDNCLSCYEQHFSTGWSFTYSLEGLGVAYRQHERLMHHWMEVCPIPIHTVQYEELVSEPEKTARSMLEYVGLDWDPVCLNPEQVESNIATASMWQARQPINTGSVEKWRRYEEQLQPLIRALEEN
ncbi:MAG: sulfotransferase [Pseudomonadota bacterium]